MSDPITIAGFVITVIDVVISHGERTAAIISDIHAFDSDSTGLYHLVNDETIQNKLLKQLLFSECRVYGGRTLFEQFDQDIQRQIELLFSEIRSILTEGIQLLEGRYGLSREPSSNDLLAISTRSQPSNPNSPASAHASLSPSLPTLLRWSLRDKKRVEAILKSFKDRNSRLKKKVELWCLASQLGLSPDHLMHLKTDGSSRELGFDKDASLRLAQWDADILPGSLELTDPTWDGSLGDLQPVKHHGLFFMFQKGSSSYIQENHHYDPSLLFPSRGPDSNATIDPRTKDRIESLAKLLHQPKEQIFRILPCVGWKYLSSKNRIAFVFEVPAPGPLGAPVSLQRLLFEPGIRPGLGDKFQLALGLSQCIAQMHMVQWLHESFRSDNIILFPHQRDPAPGASPDIAGELSVNYSEPWVLGFEFSRPEPYFSGGQADFEPERDIYRHPERQGQPTKTFEKIHDIYALGVILLEIGLWDPAIKLERNMFANADAFSAMAVRAQLIKHAERRLESRVGRRYKEAVVKCLTGEFGVEGDTKRDLKLQQAFRHQVVDVIEMAATYV